MIGTSTTAFTAALLCVGTPNAGLAAFLCSNEIEHDSTDDTSNNRNDDVVYHNFDLMNK